MNPKDEAASLEAAEALLEYACLAESYVMRPGAGETPMPAKLLSLNLHTLLCRLRDQEAARGHPAADNELWIERMIQLIKRFTKFRVSAHPERLAVHSILQEDALMEWKRQYPDLKTMSEMRPYFPKGAIDKEPPLWACQLLGTRMRGGASTLKIENQALVTLFLNDWGQNEIALVPFTRLEGMDEQASTAYADESVLCEMREAPALGPIDISCLDLNDIQVFSRANRCDDEILDSVLWSKAKSRDNKKGHFALSRAARGAKGRTSEHTPCRARIRGRGRALHWPY
mmetsp:Transcript_4818/g.14619  ORF Transcript_4818/g.14619 Transcript_4818/m.14619 type:complete len:286 (-) Transcript_4818:430-1287(-)